MRTSRHRTILAIVPTYCTSGREILMGILKYAAAHADWSLHVFTGIQTEDDLRMVPAEPDGLITSYVEEESSNLLQPARRRELPTVHVCTRQAPERSAPTASIDVDNRGISNMAFRLLNTKHVSSLGFVGYCRNGRQPDWSLEREQAFRQFCKGSCFVFGWKTEDWVSTTHRLSNWLMNLPKPSGVFCANDATARLVAEVCSEAGIVIPRQIALLGVDNDELVCEFTNPPLSSIAPDFRSCGFRAAGILDSLIAGRRTRKLHVVSGNRLFARRSSSDTTGAASRTHLAMEHIRKNLTKHLTVPGIARIVGCSPRLLEKDFKSVLCHTIVEAINRERLACVKDLLTSTSLDEESIAHRCGFGSLSRLRSLFSSNFGTTMRKWRLSN